MVLFYAGHASEDPPHFPTLLNGNRKIKYAHICMHIFMYFSLSLYIHVLKNGNLFQAYALVL